MKFAFLSHEVEGPTGYPEILGDYLRGHGARIVHIRFPFFVSHTKSIWIEHYQGTKLLSKRRSWIRFYKPQLLSFLKDFLWLMFVGWKEVKGADFVIATNNLMGFAALIFRKLGLIKSYTYLMIDYSPTRFSNPLVEKLYVRLDRLVTINADSVWPIAFSMLDGRVKAGRVKLEEVRKYFEAPMGTYTSQTFAKGEPPYDKKKMVYIGNANGTNVRADALIHLARVLKERGERFKLVFVGGGDTSRLQNMAKELNLVDCVEFIPPIPGIIELERFVASCGIGLAPYDPNLKDNFSRFADPGKIKNYLGCGVPVVTTEVPPIAKDLEARGAGLITDMTPEDYADKVMALWKDELGYVRARKEARKMGETFEWPRIFDRLMAQEGLKVGS